MHRKQLVKDCSRKAVWCAIAGPISMTSASVNMVASPVPAPPAAGGPLQAGPPAVAIKAEVQALVAPSQVASGTELSIGTCLICSNAKCIRAALPHQLRGSHASEQCCLSCYRDSMRIPRTGH